MLIKLKQKKKKNYLRLKINYNIYDCTVFITSVVCCLYFVKQTNKQNQHLTKSDSQKMQNLNLQYVYIYVFNICGLAYLQVWRISSRCHWEYNTFWLMSLLRTVKQWAQLKRCKCFCLFSVVCTVEPPCATTFRTQPPTQNTKTFPVKALQLEPLENDHLL